jgi:hypothetical protein
MSKRDIDYSNTIIYKITCTDKAVTDVYVGHTVDFVKRKYSHKQSCINIKASNYSCKVYQIIRANGGWINWKMEIINFFECKNLSEARQKEQEYFISLNATLNSIEPFSTTSEDVDKCIIKKEKIYCSICDITFSNKKLIDIHNLTSKHIKTQNLMEKNTSDSVIHTSKYKCEKCKFTCERTPDWIRHISTPKHNKLININNNDLSIIPKHICSICFKEYKSNVGLWKHKKICNNNIVIENTKIEEEKKEKESDVELKQLLVELLKSNNELKKQTNDLHQQIISLFSIGHH